MFTTVLSCLSVSHRLCEPFSLSSYFLHNNKNVTCSCVPDGFYFALWLLSTERSAKTYEKWSFLGFFSRCSLLPPGPGVDHTVSYKNHESLSYSWVPNCFSSLFGIKIDREECSNLRRRINSNFYSRLGLFPRAFGKVKESLILKLHEMIRISHVVACPIVFISFCDRDRQWECWNL